MCLPSLIIPLDRLYSATGTYCIQPQGTTASSSPPTSMSHSEYSVSHVNVPYAQSSVPQTPTHHPLSPTRLASSTLLESHLSPAVTYSHFVPTPTQELLMRRQQVHSWPLDVRSSLALPHLRPNNFHSHHSDSSSPTNSLPPPPPYHARHVLKDRHQHSQSQSDPASQLSFVQHNTVRGGTSVPWTLAGSLDPATGIFYRSPENPRLRTAQACEKCRTRKAKCSGEHPTCNRCLTRGLVCEYSKEGRLRGPNRPKIREHTNTETDRPTNVSKGSGSSFTTSVASPGSASPATAYSATTRNTIPPSNKTHGHTFGGEDKDQEREREKKQHRRPLFMTVPHPSSTSLVALPPSQVFTNSSLAPLAIGTTSTSTPVSNIGGPGASVLSPHTMDISGEGFDRVARNLYAVPSLPAMEAKATQNRFNAYGRTLGVDFGVNQHNHDATTHRMLDYPPDSNLVSSNPFTTGFGTHGPPPCANANACQMALDSTCAFHQDASAVFRSEPQYMRHDGAHDYHRHLNECEGVLIDGERWPQQGMDVGLQMRFEQQGIASTVPEDRPAVGWGTRTDLQGQTFEQ